MKTILIASHNHHKINEIIDYLGHLPLNFLTLNDLSFYDEIEENGKTLEENAYIKAKHLKDIYDYIILSDDTGLFINSLNGNPGIHSKRYGANEIECRQRVINELQNKNKDAYFKCSICLIDEDTHFFEGITNGYILEEEQGDNSFGYDCIFYSTELKKSFGESTLEEKQSVSHRGRALEKVKIFLEEKYGIKSN